jgi:hypothetical protein
MGMNNEQKSIIKKKYVHSYICRCHILDLFQATLKYIGKIFHNYFCYSKKGEYEDLLSKEQLRGKNEEN